MLLLPVSTCAFAEPSATNSVNLVHENDARLVIPCIVEHLSDQPGRLSNVLVHNGARNHLGRKEIYDSR